jgi:hypothetical protein
MQNCRTEQNERRTLQREFEVRSLEELPASRSFCRPQLKSGMTAVRSQAVAIALDDAREVSGLLQAPPGAGVCYVLAHGAGAGMSHPLMANVANGLAERRIATLRYQFPYMEQGSKRPDAPKLAQATVRAAVLEASRLNPQPALVAGGKSFGGRMTSQAQAASPLPGVRGLVFLGFPLHPTGRPSNERGSENSDAVPARNS